MIKRILPIYKTGWFYLILLFWGVLYYSVSVGGLNGINQLNINLLEKITTDDSKNNSAFVNKASSLVATDILTLHASFDEDEVTDLIKLLAYHPNSQIVLQGVQSKAFINKLRQYLIKKPSKNKIIIESAHLLSAQPLTVSSAMFLSSVLNWFRFEQSPNTVVHVSKYFIYTPFLLNTRQSYPLVWQHENETYLSLPSELLRQLTLKNELTLKQRWQLSLISNSKSLAFPLGFLGDVFTSGNAYNVQNMMLNKYAQHNLLVNDEQIAEVNNTHTKENNIPSIKQFISKQKAYTTSTLSFKENYKVIIITNNQHKVDDHLTPLLIKLADNNYLSQSFITLLVFWFLLVVGFVLIWLIKALAIKQQKIAIVIYIITLLILQVLMFNQQQWLEVIPVIIAIIGTWALLKAYEKEVQLVEYGFIPPHKQKSAQLTTIDKTTNPAKNKTSSKVSDEVKATTTKTNEQAVISKNQQLYKSPQNFSPAATLAPEVTGWGHLVKEMTPNNKASNKANNPPKKPNSNEQADLAKTLVITASEKKNKQTVNQDLDVESFGRYQIEGILGKGAMGIVYQGVDPKINRHVAIKTLQLENDLDANESTEAKERFFREAQTAGGLSHANIVTIYDVGEENNLGYIAMDLLTGAPLSVFTQVGQTLPVPLIYKLLIQITDALDYAHNQNVVHRDIKPGNIIYDDDLLKVTVTDFGIAYVSDHSKTRTGVIMGSPYYMSPEQILGLKVDGRSDIFSLGVTFYQLLTGHLPFEGESIATVAYQITKAKPIAVNQHNPELPPSAQRIINKSMHKDMEKRYQSMSEFKLALVNALKRDFKITVN
ncbi:serine/threonine-protein kinase [Colwellia sp. E2M01]|uniref:serine/threonine-protein kinase n=1 Tax=Colwellia sp. E2M01 TaxID=2841561 RepID=UPI001C09133B|nr:serine/threonine-protein kinase [Colwellia sp. E2M01]MBU2871352.1 protein kinase [Colwellia sp. E2M01]